MSIADIFNWIGEGINQAINYPIDWYGVLFVVGGVMIVVVWLGGGFDKDEEKVEAKVEENDYAKLGALSYEEWDLATPGFDKVEENDDAKL